MGNVENTKNTAYSRGSEEERNLSYSCGTGRILFLKNVALVLMVLMTILFMLLITYTHESFVVLASIWISAIPLLFAWLGTYRMMRTGQVLSGKEYRKGVLRVQQDAILVMLFCLAALFGVGEKLFRGEYTSLTREAGMLVRIVAQVGLSLSLGLVSKHHCAQINVSR